MRINLALYRANIPRVRTLVASHSHKMTQSQLASLITQATGMPLIASCYLLAGVMNRKDSDLEETIDRLIEFYNYSGVDNADI